MKKKLLSAIFGLLVMQVYAQQKLPLYNGAIPGAKKAPADYVEQVTGETGNKHIAKVTIPELEIFKPKNPNGTAIIICPGGGYGVLAYDKEGTLVAKRLADLGVTAFVLKYRLPSDAIMQDKSAGPLQDALQAMYLVRKNASVWKVDGTKIGIMGFSAGGHLASSASVHYNDIKINNGDGISLRPDFSVLIYPVISFGKYTHAGSKKNLLGEEPKPEQVAYYSNELKVNAQTPPAFLVHANDDASVSVLNSLMYDEALAKNKVKGAMHIYQSGGHGFGMYNKTTTEDWFVSLTNWLKENKWL